MTDLAAVPEVRLDPSPRPRPGGTLVHFLEHQFIRYRATWFSTVLSSVLFPVFFLLAVGFGLGSQIDDTSTLGTDDYASFIGPGVLAAVAILQAGGLSLWPTLGSIKWEGGYEAALATPLTAPELAIGHVIWIGFRVMVSGTIYLAVLVLFGVAQDPLAVLAPLVSFLTGVAVAAPLSAWSAKQESDGSFGVINRLALNPIFLFSGAFFPIEQLPAAIGAVARILPAYHAVELVRGLVLGTLPLGDGLGHVAVLAVWAGVGLVLVIRSFRARLAA